MPEVSGNIATTRGVLLLAGAVIGAGLVLQATAGTLAAAIVCGLLAVSLGLTLLAQRGEAESHDRSTGLPDRAAAIRRLDGIVAQRRPASRQGAVVVLLLEEVDGVSSRAQVLTAMLKLSESLRKGDHILRVAPHALAAVLEPARGLDVAALEGVVDRIAASFVTPPRRDGNVAASPRGIGACLESDAPERDGEVWLEAAERAAALSAAAGLPALFAPGLTPLDEDLGAEDDLAAATEARTA